MYEWQNFDVVFQGKPDYSYDEKTVSAILKNRKELAGTLFFDRVWSNLGLKDGKFVKDDDPVSCWNNVPMPWLVSYTDVSKPPNLTLPERIAILVTFGKLSSTALLRITRSMPYSIIF